MHYGDEEVHRGRFPPGLTLREELEARELTQRALAAEMQRPVQIVNEICNEKRGISADTALDLEAALGISAGFWLNLQKDYEMALALQRRAKKAAASA